MIESPNKIISQFRVEKPAKFVPVQKIKIKSLLIRFDMLRLVQVVNALKALQRSLVYGEEVSRLLQASPVWAQYEQQRHDLFIQVSHTENAPHYERKRTR